MKTKKWYKNGYKNGIHYCCFLEGHIYIMIWQRQQNYSNFYLIVFYIFFYFFSFPIIDLVFLSWWLFVSIVLTFYFFSKPIILFNQSNVHLPSTSLSTLVSLLLFIRSQNHIRVCLFFSLCFFGNSRLLLIYECLISQ